MENDIYSLPIDLQQNYHDLLQTLCGKCIHSIIRIPKDVPSDEDDSDAEMYCEKLGWIYPAGLAWTSFGDDGFAMMLPEDVGFCSAFQQREEK